MVSARPVDGAPEGFRLPRSSRIHRSSDIRTVMLRGKRKRTPHLDVFFLASPVSFPRFGLVIPKHRHRIVDRNLLKRRIREIGRTEVLPALRAAGIALDVLVRARRESYGAEFAQLREEVRKVVQDLCSNAHS